MHEHEWGSWIRAGVLPSGEVEYIRQCLAGPCQDHQTRKHRPNTWMESEAAVCAIDGETWPCAHALKH